MCRRKTAKAPPGLQAPPVLQPQLARSLGGATFMFEASRSRIYRFDPTGRDFGLIYQTNRPFGTLVGGPGGSVLVVGSSEVLQLSGDGSLREWGCLAQGVALHNLVCAPDARLISSSPDGRSVVEVTASGETRVIAGGFESIHQLAVSPSCAVCVADAHSGKVNRVDGGAAVDQQHHDRFRAGGSVNGRGDWMVGGEQRVPSDSHSRRVRVSA